MQVRFKQRNLNWNLSDMKLTFILHATIMLRMASYVVSHCYTHGPTHDKHIWDHDLIVVPPLVNLGTSSSTGSSTGTKAQNGLLQSADVVQLNKRKT